MNKVLVSIYVPLIDKKFELWLPQNKKLHNVIVLLIKAIGENEYLPQRLPDLYNKGTGIKYDSNMVVEETDIRNATELILI